MKFYQWTELLLPLVIFLSLSLNCLSLLVMLAAGDLTKQLSESFTPDNAIRFSPWSIRQQLNGFHSKESLSFFGYALYHHFFLILSQPITLQSDICLYLKYKKIGSCSGVPGVRWSGLKLQVNMSKWRNFSETSFSLEMRVKNDVDGHQPNLPQLITLTCSSFMTMVFDCCFCCKSSNKFIIWGWCNKWNIHC